MDDLVFLGNEMATFSPFRPSPYNSGALFSLGRTVGVTGQRVNEGDLVIRKGEHEAKVYFVESVDDDGILLVNGIKDEFFTDLDERSVGEESINYFYENFRLLAKKENLEVEKV